MRALVVPLAIAFALLAPGCFMLEGAPCKNDPSPLRSCSYALSGVSAVATLEGAWSGEAAREALWRMGFDVTYANGTFVVGHNGTVSGVEVRRVGPDAARAVVRFDAQTDLGYTREEAEEMGREAQRARQADLDALVARLEAETGWNATSVAWQAPGVLVV